MLRIIAACLLLSACATEPMTIAQVPGLQPLPLARRDALEAFDRDRAVRECSYGDTVLNRTTARRACACLFDTMEVYLTAKEVRIAADKLGHGGMSMIADTSRFGQVARACRAMVLGE